MSFTYAQAKEYCASIEAREKEAGKVLAAFPKLANGLTPDSAKTPEWRAARAAYAKAFADLRDWNARMSRTFKKEMLAERRAKSAARSAPASA